ncbi:AEC family transporter [Ruegeria sp.]|uniref:AEC family transporter n=1 Tax=Ruegeria sp. TaxID=1879320 RepID=UPI00230E939B|nr:AEC family transporter [Ruegeria sp.]MDA7963616.1 AEC family transporter [Ruegeria sp.]
MIVGLGLVAPFFVYILAGVVAEKLLRHSAEGQKWLDAFVFYIALPALLFQSVRTLPDGTSDIVGFLILTTMATGLMFLFGWGVGRFAKSGDHAAVYGLSASYSNIGYMGPTLTVAVLGPTAGAPAAFIFCADVLLIFSIWPAMIRAEGFSVRGLVGSLGKVIQHPFILATLAGLVFAASGLTMPDFINTPLDGFRNAAAPAALFSLGLTLSRRTANHLEIPLSVCLVGKLVLHPLLVAGLFVIFGGFDPIWIATAIIMGGLPPAANVYVMARAEGISTELAARAVFFGTALSAVTLPVIIAILG